MNYLLQNKMKQSPLNEPRKKGLGLISMNTLAYTCTLFDIKVAPILLRYASSWGSGSYSCCCRIFSILSPLSSVDATNVGGAKSMGFISSNPGGLLSDKSVIS